MAENKTKPTKQSVQEYLGNIEDKQAREDSKTIIRMMKEITGKNPVMWGASIIGFGKYRYQNAGGQQNEICMIGFSPRKTSLVLYAMSGAIDQQTLLDKLGKHKAGKGCLYIKKLDDVNPDILRELVSKNYEKLKKLHPDHD